MDSGRKIFTNLFWRKSSSCRHKKNGTWNHKPQQLGTQIVWQIWKCKQHRQKRTVYEHNSMSWVNSIKWQNMKSIWYDIPTKLNLLKFKNSFSYLWYESITIFLWKAKYIEKTIFNWILKSLLVINLLWSLFLLHHYWNVKLKIWDRKLF